MEPGWTKVIAGTGVALLGLVGLNLSIWRRLRQASRDRGNNMSQAAHDETRE